MKALTKTISLLALIAAAVGLVALNEIQEAPKQALARTQNIARQSNVTADMVMAPNSIAAYNWSGYVADKSTYSGVTSTWTVPQVNDIQGNGADATWIGIGGVSSNDLIQAGTEALPNGRGGSTYAAWYEVLPQDSQMVPLQVRPGDSMTVTLTQQDNFLWLISFRNNTTGQRYQARVPYQSSLSSAEWVEEMPVSPDSPIALDDFGSVRFSSSYALVNGSWVSIASTGAKALRMDNGSHEALAVPSQLSTGGSGFSVVRTKAAASPLQYSNGTVVPPTSSMAAPQRSYSSWPDLVTQFLSR